jgi:hypothetical protein
MQEAEEVEVQDWPQEKTQDLIRKIKKKKK